MQQEARNTETHGRAWSGNTLRHKAVLFVSAGSLDPTLEQEQEEDQTKAETDREDSGPIDPEDETEAISDEKHATKAEENTEDSDSPFFFDSKGQPPANTGHPDPIIRSNLSDLDDSSEDEVVFTGRRKNTQPVVIETRQIEIEKMVQSVSAVPQTTLTPELTRVPSPMVQIEHTAPYTEKPGWPPAEDTDPLADYIANIDSDYYEEITGMKLDSEDGIDVEKAATQLDLSASSPAGSKSESLESRVAGRHPHPEKAESSVDGKFSGRDDIYNHH
jgi:hypothetical protein